MPPGLVVVDMIDAHHSTKRDHGLFEFFIQNIFLHIQNLFNQKKGKETYLLGQIGLAHSETAPRRERIAPTIGGA
jgi:hypothetical protein